MDYSMCANDAAFVAPQTYALSRIPVILPALSPVPTHASSSPFISASPSLPFAMTGVASTFYVTRPMFNDAEENTWAGEIQFGTFNELRICPVLEVGFWGRYGGMVAQGICTKSERFRLVV